MNAHQTAIEIPPQPEANPISLPDVFQGTEAGILAAIALFLIRNLIQSNQKLTEKLLDELDDD